MNRPDASRVFLRLVRGGGRVCRHVRRFRQRIHVQRVRRVAAAGFCRVARADLARVFARRLPVLRFRHRQRAAGRPLRLAAARCRRDAADGHRAAAAGAAHTLVQVYVAYEPVSVSASAARTCRLSAPCSAGSCAGAASRRGRCRRDRRRHAGDAAARVRADRARRLARCVFHAGRDRGRDRRGDGVADRERSARARAAAGREAAHGPSGRRRESHRARCGAFGVRCGR